MFEDYKDSRKSSQRFKKNFVNYIIQNYKREMRASFDNIAVGDVILFNYNLKYPERMKYFDVFPLIMVIGFFSGGFYGINVHYLRKRFRTLFFKNIQKGKLIYPGYAIHKYLYRGLTNIFLRLEKEDFIKVASFPLDSFCSFENGRFFSHHREIAWRYWEGKKYKTYKSDIK